MSTDKEHATFRSPGKLFQRRGPACLILFSLNVEWEKEVSVHDLLIEPECLSLYETQIN